MPVHQRFFPLSFQSTPSAWRETSSLSSGIIQQVISIHSLRMEGDIPKVLLVSAEIHFNPLPPHGGRLPTHGNFRRTRLFQSTPSAWRETYNCVYRDIITCRFQSTPSAWRETERNGCATIPLNHFNPLPPHGGRLSSFFQCGAYCRFQSTPSAWRETSLTLLLLDFALFQSTPSAWRETCYIFVCHCNFSISIHSLRMEGDIHPFNMEYLLHYFNPLPPHGGRPESCGICFNHMQVFQSTPSAWRET